MPNKNFYLIMDTETAGDITYPIAYDVGWTIIDRNGEVYDKRHFLVREVFANLPMMATAYYANKFVGYLDRVATGEIVVADFIDIIRTFNASVENILSHGHPILSAYNLNFDLRSMKNTSDWLFDNPNWCKYDLDKLCIMCAACDVLYDKKYIKMCRDNGWVTEKGNVKCSAETGYRFVSGNLDFEEEHRGLDDCEIEAQILLAILNKHKKFDGTPTGFPMRKVYNREKEQG